MRALDLFCGGGGAAQGLLEAGFDEVVGVDRDPTCGDYYPGTFVVGDALDWDPTWNAEFDLIWASPPCQRYSVGTPDHARASHPDLVESTRRLIAAHPWTVIENVPGAPLHTTLVLTGPMVGLDRIQRRRHFEMSWLVWQPPIRNLPPGEMAAGRAVTITKSLCSTSHYYPRKKIGLPGRVPVREAREAMGITAAMPARMVGEAVPPPMARWIAEQFIAVRTTQAATTAGG